MEQKKSKFKIIFVFIALLFTFFYFSNNNLYYQNKSTKNAILTKEAILEFESDIKDGKNVDIKDYLNSNRKENYSNKYSNLGNQVSELLSNIINGGISIIMKIMHSLFG